MESFPGISQKIQEYALRIINGENPDKVLEGADTFRPGVEAAIAEYKERQKEKIEEQNNEGVLDVPADSISEEMIQQRQEDDNKRIESLQAELQKELITSESDPFAHKEVYEGAGEDHIQGVQIYNTFMNIGKELSDGMKEAFDPKVQQYVNEIRSGKSREYVLGGAPKSMVEAVEKKLAEDSAENSVEEHEGQRNTREELNNKIKELSKDYYFLTHQTYSDFAEKINNEDFLFQGGGLNTTTLVQGPEGIDLSLKKMDDGESHRNSNSMVIFAVPKRELPKRYQLEGSERSRFHPDAFADMLIDTKLEETTKSGSLRIPHEYILGIYEKGKGFLFNK